MKLAINGGTPIRSKHFPAYRVIGEEEKNAVADVLDSGILSRFLGCWHKDFYGGPMVQTLEKRWAEYFGTKNAIAVNSATSGLYCAVGAAGVGPGDEVIVSPYTMSASATAVLIFNAVPVFADIEEDYFCLDPLSVEKKITKRTKAIIIVDIFGQPYDMKSINHLAKKHNLVVIEDAAQAPGAKYKDKFAGTLGDIGIFSLNYHKHIHSGEGGIVVTNNEKFAEKIRLIRNHGEAVAENKGEVDIVNLVGFNFRMTEIEAAISICQLDKLENLLDERQKNCMYINAQLSKIPGITPVPVREFCTHSYYLDPFKFDEEKAGVSRDKFIEAVKAELPVTELREAEGVKISSGYVKPLYLQPIFQKQIAFGAQGCPFKCPWYKGETNYNKGLCPVSERMYRKEFFYHELMRPPMTKNDLDDVAKAFFKVYENLKELQ